MERKIVKIYGTSKIVSAGEYNEGAIVVMLSEEEYNNLSSLPNKDSEHWHKIMCDLFIDTNKNKVWRLSQYSHNHSSITNLNSDRDLLIELSQCIKYHGIEGNNQPWNTKESKSNI